MVQITAWRRPGKKPLSEPLMVSLLTHICVTRPQWVKLTLRAWWRLQRKTCSALLTLCAGNSPVTSEFPSQRPVMQIFVVSFDQRLNKWLSKQWRCWWFQMPSPSLWCHCNGRTMMCLLWEFGRKLILLWWHHRVVKHSWKQLNELCNYWFRESFVASSAPSYSLNESRLEIILPKNEICKKFYWKLKKNFSRKCIWKCWVQNLVTWFRPQYIKWLFKELFAMKYIETLLLKGRDFVCTWTCDILCINDLTPITYERFTTMTKGNLETGVPQISTEVVKYSPMIPSWYDWYWPFIDHPISYGIDL